MYIKASDIRKAVRGKNARLCRSEHDKFLCDIGPQVRHHHFKPVFVHNRGQIKKGVQRIIYGNHDHLAAKRDCQIGATTSTPQLGAFPKPGLDDIKCELGDLCTIIDRIHLDDHSKPR